MRPPRDGGGRHDARPVLALVSLSGGADARHHGDETVPPEVYNLLACSFKAEYVSLGRAKTHILL